MSTQQILPSRSSSTGGEPGKQSCAELRDKHRTLGVAWPVLRVIRQSVESWASDSFPEEAPLERSESSLWSGHEGEGGAIQGWALQEQAGQELGLLENRVVADK